MKRLALAPFFLFLLALAGSLEAPVSLSVRDLSPAQAFQALSRAAGVQVVYLGGLEGRASLEIRERPLPEVLAALIGAYGGSEKVVYQVLPGGAVAVGPVERLRAYVSPYLVLREYSGLSEEALKATLRVGRYAPLGEGRFAVWATPEEHGLLQALEPLPEGAAVLPVRSPEAKALVEGALPGVKAVYLEKTGRLVLRGSPLQLAEARRLLEASGLLGDPAPQEGPVLRSFSLRYLEPKEALPLLEALAGKELVGKLVVNEGAKVLYGVLTPAEAARLVEALATVDKPLKQLELLVRVEQVDEQDARSLGLDWQAASGGLAFSVVQGTLELSLDTGVSAALSLLSRLKALETQGRSRTLINTRLVTLDGNPVRLQSGGKLLLPQLTPGPPGGGGGGPTGYFTFDYGLQVGLTPRVAGEEVVLEVEVGLGGVPASGPAGGVTVSNQSVRAKVRVLEGATTVLGGVVSQAENQSVAAAPFLSSIPLLGELFKTRTSGSNQSVLLILISPRVLR